MWPLLSALLTALKMLLRSRFDLLIEIVALRHQLAVYQQTVKRPKLSPSDRLFWSCLSRLWPVWPCRAGSWPCRAGSDL